MKDFRFNNKNRFQWILFMMLWWNIFFKAIEKIFYENISNRIDLIASKWKIFLTLAIISLFKSIFQHTGMNVHQCNGGIFIENHSALSLRKNFPLHKLILFFRTFLCSHKFIAMKKFLPFMKSIFIGIWSYNKCEENWWGKKIIIKKSSLRWWLLP